MTSFGDELRALMPRKTTERVLEPAVKDFFDYFFVGDERFVAFIRVECRAVVTRFEKEQATFIFRESHMMGKYFICKETDRCFAISWTGDLAVIAQYWCNSSYVRSVFQTRLSLAIGGVAITTEVCNVSFDVVWQKVEPAEPAKPTIDERFERLEQLILALPPIAGGADYLAAVAHFDERRDEQAGASASSGDAAAAAAGSVPESGRVDDERASPSSTPRPAAKRARVDRDRQS